MTLDGEAPAQISRNLGHFWNFDKFGHKKQGFSPYASRHVARAFARELQIARILHFWIFMKNHGFWCMAKKFGQVLSPQEVKNTQKMTSLPLF